MAENNQTETVKPENLWSKCTGCDQIIYKKELAENLKICPKCGYYLRMTARERIEMLADKNEDGSLAFQEFDADLASLDPLDFADTRETHSMDKNGKAHKSPYLAKVASDQKKTHLSDAIVCGEARIEGRATVLAVMDFYFMGGSMGSVVGEKVTRAVEHALEKKIPIIIASSSGGARMQEGVLSLMQMAKTSAALARLHQEGILCISLLCDPTTGGVTASYAMLGDVHIAEPKALVAFAGPRVIEQIIHQKLPEGFQQSEFLVKHGMVDCIVERKALRSKLAGLLKFFSAAA